MTKLKGIDVSKWQGDIDWNKVKSDGVEFAMVRSGYSSNYTDPYFEQNHAKAKANGIKVGAYHYSYAVNATQAKAEANYVIKLLKGKKLDYPVAFDIEDSTQQSLGKKMITDIIAAFCDTIKNEGLRPMLYTNTNWRANFIDMSRVADLLLWQAHYPPDPNVRPEAVDEKVSIWQYTSKGRVNGISGDVDMNWGYEDLSVTNTPTVITPSTPANSDGNTGYMIQVVGTGRQMLSAVGNAFRTAQRPKHDGMDLVDAERKERTQDVYIVAAADGVVSDTIVGASIGYSVSIRHEGDIVTRYYHMKAGSVCVRESQSVKKGDRLGIMGTTGDSTGIHLHFGVKEKSKSWYTGEYVDPMPYLTGEKAIGAISASTSSAPPSEIKVNKKVRVNRGAKNYDGKGVAAFVYDRVYTVDQLKNDRAVLDTAGICTAFNVRDLLVVA